MGRKLSHHPTAPISSSFLSDHSIVTILRSKITTFLTNYLLLKVYPFNQACALSYVSPAFWASPPGGSKDPQT